jgi:hypothetical protein
MVCFRMPVQPSFPRVIPVPQYSQVMTISPNFGEIGAPQCGQFRDVTPKGARIGPVEAVACFGCDVTTVVPHFVQKMASSGSCVPHLWQYKVKSPFHYWEEQPLLNTPFSFF